MIVCGSCGVGWCVIIGKIWVVSILEFGVGVFLWVGKVLVWVDGDGGVGCFFVGLECFCFDVIIV